jgi:DNA-binding MarR family transcriptional regulator
VVENTPKRLRKLPSRLLSMAATHADRTVTEALAARGARKWHYAVLATLAEFGPASQAGLSERTHLYPSDLVAVINELTAQGLVERSADPADRRRNVITMTDEGDRRLRELDGVLAEVEDVVLAGLAPADRAELTRLLTALVRHHRHG